MKKELKKRIYEAGQNDTYVEDVLIESAMAWIDKELDLDDEDERREAIDVYRDGFMGK